MIPDRIWDILEQQGVVPAPKLPDVGKVATKAREKGCSVQVNYPADPDEFVFAVVTRQGQTFTGEAAKDVESVAIALADCLEATEPVQLDFMDAQDRAEEEELPATQDHPDAVPEPWGDPPPKKRKRSGKRKSAEEQAAEHLDALGESVFTDAPPFDPDAEHEMEMAEMANQDDVDQLNRAEVDVIEAGYSLDDIEREAEEEDGM